MNLRQVLVLSITFFYISWICELSLPELTAAVEATRAELVAEAAELEAAVADAD